MGIRSDLQGSTLSAVVASLLISEFINRLRRLHWNTRTVEFSWVLEDNYRMRAIIESSGAKLTKRYRVFEKPLAQRREVA